MGLFDNEKRKAIQRSQEKKAERERREQAKSDDHYYRTIKGRAEKIREEQRKNK